ncbi:MAG: hypothetical protein IEMM0008_1430 [bacterium]|nr:MAG: hypothetical protein IEMM0008_1430 [bacterium]
MNHDQSRPLSLPYKSKTLLWGIVFLFVGLTYILSCNNNEPPKHISSKKKTMSTTVQVKYYKNYRIDDNGGLHYFEPIKKEKALTSHHYRLHYDQIKRIIKEEEFDKKGRLKRYSKITYQDGKKLEEVYTGSKDLIFVRHYDVNEALVKEEKYSSGQLRKYIDFTYNKKGHKKQESHYRADGVLELFKTFKYNSKNQLIRVNTHRPQGEKSMIHQYVVYRYNNKGEKKKERHYALGYSSNRESQKYLLIREYKYTSKGIQVTALQYDQNNKVLKKEEYLYNAQGEEIKPVTEQVEGGIDENHKPNDSNLSKDDNKSHPEKSN